MNSPEDPDSPIERSRENRDGSSSLSGRHNKINFIHHCILKYLGRELNVNPEDGMIDEHVLYFLYHGHWTTDKAKKVLIKVLKKQQELDTLQLLKSELLASHSIKHVNILEAIGWSRRDNEEDFSVVHDHMPRGTLYTNLQPTGPAILPWTERYRVSCGLASVMLHLHKQKILHRNLTSHAVLLASDGTPKLTSFMLAKSSSFKAKVLFPRNNIQLTELIKRIQNLAFYYRGDVVTPAFDVYSFGMVLLVIATGLEDSTIVERVCNSSEWHKIRKEAHQRFIGHYDPKEMERVLLAGLCCALPPIQSCPPLEDVVGYLMGIIDYKMISPFIEAHHMATGSSSAEEQQASTSQSRSIIGLPPVDFASVHIPETFDIGIPEDYSFNGPLQNKNHHLIINGLLGCLLAKISKNESFESIRETITNGTTLLVNVNAPLEDWNLNMQLILRRSKQVEYLTAKLHKELKLLVAETPSHFSVSKAKNLTSQAEKEIHETIETCKAEISEYKTNLNDIEALPSGSC